MPSHVAGNAVLLLSNAVALVATVRSAYVWHYLLAVTSAASSYASVSWHSCQHADIGHCRGYEPQQLGYTDYVFACVLGLVTTAAIADASFCRSTRSAVAWAHAREVCIALPIAAILFLAHHRTGAGQTKILAFTIFVSTMYILVAIVKAVQDPTLAAHWRARWWALPVAIMLLLGGFSLKHVGGEDTRVTHGGWHLAIYGLVALVAFCLPRRVFATDCLVPHGPTDSCVAFALPKKTRYHPPRWPRM